MKWEDLFRKQYLAAKDIPVSGITGVIQRIEIEDVGGEERPKDLKPVLYLEGVEQGITVNLTRHEILENAWGEDSDNCIGKELKVTRGKTLHMGKVVPCIVFYAVSPPTKVTDPNVTVVN